MATGNRKIATIATGYRDRLGIPKVAIHNQ